MGIIIFLWRLVCIGWKKTMEKTRESLFIVLDIEYEEQKKTEPML